MKITAEIQASVGEFTSCTTNRRIALSRNAVSTGISPSDKYAGVKSLEIPPNYKFALVAIETAPTPPETFFPLRFDGGLWATSRTPFQMDDVWKKWLGLQADNFDRSNLYLLATVPSKAPGVLDDESQALERTARFLFVSLLIEGLYLERAGLILHGAKLPEPIGIQIRSIRDTLRAYRAEGYITMELSLPVLLRAARIAANMERLFQKASHRNANPFSKPICRLWKGVMSLISAVEAKSGDERLHRFVRAVEAVTKSPQGEGKRKFVHRGSLFAGRRETDRKLLEELYLLRSATEHLNDSVSLLSAYEFHERNRIALQRAVQSEVLARSVYVRILASDEMTTLFSDDAWLDQFWAMRDDQTGELWGNPVDLHSIPLLTIDFL